MKAITFGRAKRQGRTHSRSLNAHQVPSRLNLEQRLELKRILLEQKPIDYGIDRNIWTGKIISSVIESRWEIKLKTTRIYEILDELNLSHQKAHLRF